MKKYDRNRNLVIIIFILSVCPFYYLVILSAHVGREDFLVFRARSRRAGLERRNYGALTRVRKTLLQVVHQETTTSRHFVKIKLKTFTFSQVLILILT